MFEIGQEVECINVDYTLAPPYLPVGTRATVSWVGFVDAYANDPRGGTVIDLVEYPAPETATQYRGHVASQWRAIVKRKTDISQLTALLKPALENA